MPMPDLSGGARVGDEGGAAERDQRVDARARRQRQQLGELGGAGRGKGAAMARVSHTRTQGQRCICNGETPALKTTDHREAK